MSLKLRTQRDGTLRPCWYGVYTTDGKKKESALCRWRGTPPPSGRAADMGDAAFEASRAKARTALEQIAEQGKGEADKAVLVDRIYRARYGTKLRRVNLSDFPDEWMRFNRKRKVSPAHAANIQNVLQTFAAFMAGHKVTESGAVTAELMRAFMDAQEKRGITPRTWNVILGTLRGVFKRLDPYSPAYTEYLQRTTVKDEDTIHRTPFTDQELESIYKAAKQDPFMHNLIVTAAETALRRGDVCLLRWRDVDLQSGFITVKTRKSGEIAEIPISAPLRSVLERQSRSGEYVFPAAAKLYRERPNALDQRLAALIDAAGVADPHRKPRAKTAETAAGGDIKLAAMSAIAGANWKPEKADRVREVIERYTSGQSVKQIEKEAGISRSCVSGYLSTLEDLTGLPIVRRVESAEPASPPSGTGQRLRRASVRGWHSFRTSFITRALTRGVPESFLRRLTGHASVDVVLKHYFRPSREQFRQAFLISALPDASMNEPKQPSQPERMISSSEVLAHARRLSGKTWEEIRDNLFSLVGSMP